MLPTLSFINIINLFILIFLQATNILMQFSNNFNNIKTSLLSLLFPPESPSISTFTNILYLSKALLACCTKLNVPCASRSSLYSTILFL